MREIKFRGKVRTEGVPIIGPCPIEDGEWIYGDLHLRCKYPHIHYGPGLKAPIDLDTIGQYTGLTDATGKEIYEGDIISNDKHPYKHLIYYDAAEACFMAKYGPGKDDSCRVYQEWINTCHKQVIGNIHDNPKLIEQ